MRLTWHFRVLFTCLCIILNVNQKASNPQGLTQGSNCPSSCKSPASRTWSSNEEECPLYCTDDATVEVRVLTEAYAKSTNALGSTWLTKDMTNFDITRFLGAHKMDPAKTSEALIQHSKWRTETHGAVDVVSRAAEFENSPLNKEIFWMGVNAEGVPTLVIRSNFHDGKHYDDDPKKYTDFIVYQIEKGRRLYGVGAVSKGCVVVDRYAVNPDIEDAELSFDLSFIPAMMNTFKHLKDVVRTNYPDIIESINIVPSTWFSQCCWRILSTMLERDSRELFRMVGAKDVGPLMSRLFDASRLPSYLGGHSETYGGACFACSGPMNGRHGHIFSMNKDAAGTAEATTKLSGGAYDDSNDVVDGSGSTSSAGRAPLRLLRTAWASMSMPRISSTELEQYLSMEV